MANKKLGNEMPKMDIMIMNGARFRFLSRAAKIPNMPPTSEATVNETSNKPELFKNNCPTHISMRELFLFSRHKLQDG